MDYLKEGIGLRAMAQRDPLVEYQREGYDMFIAMLDGLKEESVGFLFNVQVEAAPAAPAVAPMDAPQGLAEFAAAAKESGASDDQPEPAPQVHAKGIDGDEDKRPLTYSGPAEDGHAEVQRRSGGAATGKPSGSRRERREAARKAGKARR
jgi:preprotein translocase subunit SecA